LVATGKKLPTERVVKVAKNEAVKSASATTTSASKAQQGKFFFFKNLTKDQISYLNSVHRKSKA
jgi:hypothetical protein